MFVFFNTNCKRLYFFGTNFFNLCQFIEFVQLRNSFNQILPDCFLGKETPGLLAPSVCCEEIIRGMK